MRIDFNEPFSLKELISSFNKSSDEPAPQKLFKHANSSNSLRRLRHQPSTSSLYGTDVVNEEHRQLVDSIARHVVYDCASATAVMTTNAVTFLLLTRWVLSVRPSSNCPQFGKTISMQFAVITDRHECYNNRFMIEWNRFRDGGTISVMAEALDELRDMLRSTRAISFTGDSRDVIDYAAKLLGPGKWRIYALYFLFNEIWTLPMLILNFVLTSTLTIESQDWLYRRNERANNFTNQFQINEVSSSYHIIRIVWPHILHWTQSLCAPYKRSFSYTNNKIRIRLVLFIYCVKRLSATYLPISHSLIDLTYFFQEFEIGRKELIQACVEYCDILRYEFLFSKPCQQLNDLLDDSFDRLKAQNLLALPPVSQSHIFLH